MFQGAGFDKYLTSHRFDPPNFGKCPTLYAFDTANFDKLPTLYRLQAATVDKYPLRKRLVTPNFGVTRFVTPTFVTQSPSFDRSLLRIGLRLQILTNALPQIAPKL